MMNRSTRALAAASALALGLTACASDADTESTGGTGDLAAYDLSGQTYVVGSKDFTEQLMLGNIAMLALREAGAEVEDQIGLAGTAAARAALESGDIDMYWEYNGTGWGTHLGNSLDPSTMPEDLTDQVAALDAANGIVWLPSAPFNNTYAFAIAEENDLDVNTISDIAALAATDPSAVSLCIESEFSTRDDGLPGLEKFYGFDWPDDVVDVIDTGLVYTQTDAGECTFGEVFASDGRISNLGLRLIEDDLNFFPPYNPSPTFNQTAFDTAPDVLTSLFADVASVISIAEMTEMNKNVDVDGMDPEDVARDFLTSKGLIG
ncbi:MAG: osmoprotectant transport system substrate-binding protein [Myxococcota bacterium]|jgi:osmoprotectant transport system substrate-binding protein